MEELTLRIALAPRTIVSRIGPVSWVYTFHYPIPNNNLLFLNLAISPEGQEVFSSTLAGQL